MTDQVDNTHNPTPVTEPLALRLSEGLGPNAQDDERERTSYLTEDEVQAAQTLHKRAPFALCNVSMGFFSIARHYGGLTFQGCHYTYMPGHDECVRDDVLRMVTKLRKKPAGKKTEPAPQPMLDLGA
jgi:hypothetical protein